MMIQTDGKIIVAGCNGELMPGDNDWALWRFNSDGSLDESFGDMGQTKTDFYGNADEALGLTLYKDKIILAGKTRNATNFLDFAIARYTNDTSYNVSLPENNALETSSIGPNPVKNNSIVHLDFQLKQADVVSIELFSLNGSSIVLMPLQKMPEGKQSIQFKIPSSLPGSVYSLKINGTNFPSKEMKLVVID